MNRRQPTSDPNSTPLSEEKIEEAVKVFQALERRIEETRQSNSVKPEPRQLVKLARHLQSLRRRRFDYFDADLFADPAWDMLLALYISEHEGHRMTISGLCNFSEVPATTALRWLERLLQVGWVARRQNPLDARSSFVELRADSRDKLDAFLETAWRDYFPVD